MKRQTPDTPFGKVLEEVKYSMFCDGLGNTDLTNDMLDALNIFNAQDEFDRDCDAKGRAELLQMLEQEPQRLKK